MTSHIGQIVGSTVFKYLPSLYHLEPSNSLQQKVAALLQSNGIPVREGPSAREIFGYVRSWDQSKIDKALDSYASLDQNVAQTAAWFAEVISDSRQYCNRLAVDYFRLSGEEYQRVKGCAVELAKLGRRI